MNNDSTRGLKNISCGMAAVGVVLLSSSAWATLIPSATKSVITADGKALIEVQAPGASPSTIYAFQVATAGKGGDCKNELSFITSKTIGGCIASVQGAKNSALIALPLESAKYQYRVLAFDPNGSNPKNSGWSSWGALFQVTGISPTTDVKVGKATTFSAYANGTGPKSMVFALAGCAPAGNNGFTCTPNEAGSKEWIVKDQPSGTALAKGVMNVAMPDFIYKKMAYAANPNGRGWCYPQCVEFVKENLNIAGGRTYAKEYWTNVPTGYSNYPQGSAKAPQPGDILVWGGSLNPKKKLDICPESGCGHVAIVKSVDLAKGVLVRVDANWLKGCQVAEHNMTITKDAGGKYKIGGGGSEHLLGWQAK